MDSGLRVGQQRTPLHRVEALERESTCWGRLFSCEILYNVFFTFQEAVQKIWALLQPFLCSCFSFSSEAPPSRISASSLSERKPPQPPPAARGDEDQKVDSVRSPLPAALDDGGGVSEFDRLCNDPYQFYQEIVKARENPRKFPFNRGFIFLSLCTCPKLNELLRIKLETDSVELVQQTHPNKEELITIVSVGPGGLYQELVYLAKLAKAGYKRLRLITIDPKTVMIGALDSPCQALIPAEITIDNQFTSLDDYFQKARDDNHLLPDLLLLIDLTDDQFKINSQLLSDYSFDEFYRHKLLKMGAVVAHSALEITSKVDESGDVKRSYCPKVFCGIVTEKIRRLSSI